MLKQLRHKKTAKKIWIILAIVIVPAFVLWGSGSLMRNKQEPAYAGIIFGKKITFLEYKDALNAVRNAAIMQFGDNFSEIQRYLDLESQAWDRLVLLAEAKRRKINVSDKEVIGLIKSYPFFQRKDQFDNRLYSSTLQYVFGIQPRLFEEQTRQNLFLSKLYNQVTDNIKVTEEEVTKEYKKLNEEISLYYIASIPAEFTKDIVPEEQELKDYFAKNSLQFKQPLSFNLDYISQDSEDKIKEVALRLNKKESLEKIVKELNLAIKETGLFAQTDPIPGIGWSPKILDLVAKLKIGQFSSPIQVDKNYYILRLRERKEAYIPDFEKIKGKVKEEVLKDKSTKMAKDKIEECLKKLKEAQQKNPDSVDFDKAAKECGLKSDSTALFKYGSYIEGIGGSDSFWTAARDLKGNEFSGIINAPSGFYIVKLKSQNPIDENKFASEKAQFSQNLLSQKKQEYFNNFLQELKRKTQWLLNY